MFKVKYIDRRANYIKTLFYILDEISKKDFKDNLKLSIRGNNYNNWIVFNNSLFEAYVKFSILPEFNALEIKGEDLITGSYFEYKAPYRKSREFMSIIEEMVTNV